MNSSLPNYTHTQFTDVDGPIPQIVWINPQDSENLEIEDGEAVEVYNDLGKVTSTGTVTDKVAPGMFCVLRPVTGIDWEPDGTAWHPAYLKLLAEVQCSTRPK